MLEVLLEGSHTCPFLLCVNGTATLLHGAWLLSLTSLKPVAAFPQDQLKISWVLPSSRGPGSAYTSGE